MHETTFHCDCLMINCAGQDLAVIMRVAVFLCWARSMQ